MYDREQLRKMKKRVELLREKILAARGEILSDLVLKGGRVVNVFTGEIQNSDVAVHGGFVVGLGPGYRGKEEVELHGEWVVPGLIDGHLHIESTMLIPSRLSTALLPLGSTAVVSDPHEIANVMGIEGIRFMLRESRSLPLDIFFMSPSCVPATHLETSGARIDASHLLALRKEPRVLGLAEVMNYPGVLLGEQDILKKLLLFRDRPVDGHAPSLTGRDLQAYVSAGIRSDHETFDLQVGREKVASGMTLMIREGTSAKNLEELLPLVTAENSSRFCLVSDDLHPRDILRRGHMDFIIRKAIRLGLNPITAVRLATINPATYFGLRHRGAVAAGYHADLVVLENLDRFSVKRVYKDGVLVAEEGRLCGSQRRMRRVPTARAFNIPALDPRDFRIPAGSGNAKVISLVPGQIVTHASYVPLPSENGYVKSDTEADILKIAVVERHTGSGRIGKGMVKGFGLKRGALASSVAHDSHNVIAVGVDDRDLCRAVHEVRDMGGGMAAVTAEQVLGRAPLEVGGLMSTAPIGTLVGQLEDLDRAAALLGCAVADPYMIMSFLALPVIPELKLTDKGLVDVNRFELVPLFADQHDS